MERKTQWRVDEITTSAVSIEKDFRKNEQRAFDLIVDKLGRQPEQLDTRGTIRSSELRQLLYAKFGAD
jgi:hypothetical protein